MNVLKFIKSPDHETSDMMYFYHISPVWWSLEICPLVYYSRRLVQGEMPSMWFPGFLAKHLVESVTITFLHIFLQTIVYSVLAYERFVLDNGCQTPGTLVQMMFKGLIFEKLLVFPKEKIQTLDGQSVLSSTQRHTLR